jgi:hypothetical protein
VVGSVVGAFDLELGASQAISVGIISDTSGFSQVEPLHAVSCSGGKARALAAARGLDTAGLEPSISRLTTTRWRNLPAFKVREAPRQPKHSNDANPTHTPFASPSYSGGASPRWLAAQLTPALGFIAYATHDWPSISEG